jgi:hypothetical protein
MSAGGDANDAGRDTKPQVIGRRVPYREARIGVAFDSALLGLWGLPVAVSRYREGRASETEVARAFVRARLLSPEDFTFTDDELPELVRIMAPISRSPRVSGESLTELADALVREQERREKQFQNTMNAAAQKMAAAQATLNRGAEALRTWMEPMQQFLNAHPELKALLAESAGGEPTQGLRDLTPDLREHERRLREDLRRTDEKARLDRSKGLRDPLQPHRTLQQQLSGPADSFRALGLIIQRLHESSVQVPPSVERVAHAHEPSEEDVREAAGDVAGLARTLGEEDSADFLEQATRRLFYAESQAETWTLDEFAEQVAKHVAARTPSRTRTSLDGFAIALFFYLLTLFGPAPLNTPEPDHLPSPPPVVSSAPNPAPVVDIDININVEVDQKKARGEKSPAPSPDESRPKRAGPTRGR